jgi:hypothetical protein
MHAYLQPQSDSACDFSVLRTVQMLIQVKCAWWHFVDVIKLSKWMQDVNLLPYKKKPFNSKLRSHTAVVKPTGQDS